MNWDKVSEFYEKVCKNSNKLELYKKLVILQISKKHKHNKNKKPIFNKISFNDWNEVDEVLNQVVQQVFGVENWSDFHSILSQTHDWYESLDKYFFPQNELEKFADKENGIAKAQNGKPSFSIIIEKDSCYLRYNEGKRNLRGRIDFPLKDIKDNTPDEFVEILMDSIIEMEINKSAKAYMVNRLYIINEYIYNGIEIPKELINGLIKIDYRDLSDKSILDIFRGYSQKSCDRIYRTAEKFKRMGLVSTVGKYEQMTIFDKIKAKLFGRRKELPPASTNRSNYEESEKAPNKQGTNPVIVSNNRQQPENVPLTEPQKTFADEEKNSHDNFAKKISETACDDNWDPIINHLKNICEGKNTRESNIKVNYRGVDSTQTQSSINEAHEYFQNECGFYHSKVTLPTELIKSFSCDSIHYRNRKQNRWDREIPNYDISKDMVYLSLVGDDSSCKRATNSGHGVLVTPYSSCHDSIDLIFGTKFPKIEDLSKSRGFNRETVLNKIKDSVYREKVDRTISNPDMVCNAVGLLLHTCKKTESSPKVILGMKNAVPKDYFYTDESDINSNEINPLDLLREMYLLIPEGMRPYINFVCNPSGSKPDVLRLINIVPSEEINKEKYNNGFNFDLSNQQDFSSIVDPEITKYLRILCKMKPEDRESKLNKAFLDEMLSQKNMGKDAKTVLWNVRYHMGSDIIKNVWKNTTRGLSIDENGNLIEDKLETPGLNGEEQGN